MANEGSEAGKFYNGFALQFIEDSFQEIAHIKPFDIIESIKERFIGLSNILMEANKNCPLITKDDFINYDNVIKERKIRLKNERDIILKRYYIDELGFSDLRNNGFSPCYNYFVIDDKLILRLEVPGNTSILVNYKIGEKFNIIEVKGEKKKDREPINLQDNIANDREFGEFAIDIPIMMYLDSSIKPEINVDKGICTIKYQIRKNTKIVSVYKEVDEEMI
jgi:HSP20 family molecular chaperone IbpA